MIPSVLGETNAPILELSESGDPSTMKMSKEFKKHGTLSSTTFNQH